MARPMTRRAVGALALLLPLASVLGVQASTAMARAADPLQASPIEHVVVIDQENHSFNELLGALCIAQGNRCAATNTGRISTGETIPLAAEGDIPPHVGHTVADQVTAIHGGEMDGWDLMPRDEFGIRGCAKDDGYPCMEQVPAGGVPNLWSLADAFTISDMTFESDTVPSWGSHMELVSATLDGFVGDQPDFSGDGTGPGNGCDSYDLAKWSPNAASTQTIKVPSCIPDTLGNGPYRPSPVQYVPTVMDRIQAAGLSWGIWAPGKHGGAGYGWAICPTFFECLGSNQVKNVKESAKFAGVAAAGKLPSLSFLIPYPANSQHNGNSLIKGDNWIADNVSAIMNGPDWATTAIFITYDDCGCFYDPVAPPPQLGVRVPMVIVSPYAKPHFVDSGVASFASLLAFTEHVFGLPPLANDDANAYDYAGSFDFSQRPLRPIPLPHHQVPRSSLAYMAAHPPNLDDPT